MQSNAQQNDFSSSSSKGSSINRRKQTEAQANNILNSNNTVKQQNPYTTLTNYIGKTYDENFLKKNAEHRVDQVGFFEKCAGEIKDVEGKHVDNVDLFKIGSYNISFKVHRDLIFELFPNTMSFSYIKWLRVGYRTHNNEQEKLDAWFIPKKNSNNEGILIIATPKIQQIPKFIEVLRSSKQKKCMITDCYILEEIDNKNFFHQTCKFFHQKPLHSTRSYLYNINICHMNPQYLLDVLKKIQKGELR